MNNAHFVQLIGNNLCEAALVQEGVSYDEHSLLVHYGLELLEGNRQTALLDIYLFRRTEPEHILSPLSKCLDIEQVLNTYVFGNGVTAP